MPRRELTDQEKVEAYYRMMAQRKAYRVNSHKSGQLDAQIIKRKLEEVLGSKAVFCRRIREYFTDNYFHFLYQSLQSSIISIATKNNEIDIEKWKKLFSANNLLELLNDIYRTRLSKRGICELKGKILQHNDWDDYRGTLSLFADIVKREVTQPDGSPLEIRINVFSIGTKVLHTYNPNLNPIIDDVILTSLNLKGQMGRDGIPFCVQLRDAFNAFADENQDYFNLPSDLQCYLEDINIDTNIPIMKMLDIALYKKN